MARRGCEPAPEYPGDVYGIRFLLETARQLRSHTMLQQRRRMLDTLGHTIRHRTFPDPFVTITTDDPENVKAVLSTKFEDWNIPALRIHSFLPVLGRHSIFMTNGPEWAHSRAIMRPAFVRDQISDLACFDRHIDKLVARIRRAGGRPVDLQALFSMLTTDSISDFMFGHTTGLLGADADADALRFGACFDASMQAIARKARLGWLTLVLPDRELAAHTRFMRAFVAKYVAEVRAKQQQQQRHSSSTATTTTTTTNPPSSDDDDGNEHSSDEREKYVFLHELLRSGEPDDVVRDHLLSIFTAGRDTTTSVLSYLFYELSRRADVAARIRGEMAAAALQQRRRGDDPTWEDLRGMRYLGWVVKEALRLNPPVASNQREAVRDTVLPRGGGPDGSAPVFVAKGTTCRYLPWVMHRRKDIYGDDADEFRPERWENLRLTFEYLPFNAGPRICIGQQFALTQLAMVTFRLLQAFPTIERRDDRPPIQRLGVNTSMLYGTWVSMT
ncbi:cytochrome P450 [Biscogniauxia mediterranea]|nr:cytochrome P450 [Biscogniauxia mediterranea]